MQDAMRKHHASCALCTVTERRAAPQAPMRVCYCRRQQRGPAAAPYGATRTASCCVRRIMRSSARSPSMRKWAMRRKVVSAMLASDGFSRDGARTCAPAARAGSCTHRRGSLGVNSV